MLKGNNAREKAEYFWMYYKAPFLAVLAVVLIAVYWVSAAAGEKEKALSVLLIDSHAGISNEEMEDGFVQYAAIGEDKEVSVITELLFSDASSGTYAMTSLSRFYVDVGKQELDVCGMLEKDFSNYAKTDCFLDLRTCMSEEFLEELVDDLYFRGGKPIGVYSRAFTKLKKAGCYEDDKAVLGILYNSTHIETAVKYLEYLDGH